MMRPLSLQDKVLIDHYLFNLNNNHSAVNFTNLFILDSNNDTYISETPIGLLVQQMELFSDRKFYLLIPNRTDLNTNDLATLNVPELSLYPYPVTGAIEDPNDTDYLYSIPEWTNLAGQKYASIRRKINYFNANYEFTFRQLIENDHQNLWNFMDNLLTTNIKTNPEQSQSLQAEALALEKLMLFGQNLKINLFGLFIDETLSGFTATESIPGQTILIHLFRTHNDFSGIGETLFHETSEYHHNKMLMNFEQDLGITGLRKFKEYLNPVAKLPVYTIKFTN